jgi:hypothetical protein
MPRQFKMSSRKPRSPRDPQPPQSEAPQQFPSDPPADLQSPPSPSLPPSANPLPAELLSEQSSLGSEDAPSIDTAHFDDAPADEMGEAAAPEVLLTKDQFTTNFIGVFNLGGALTGMKSLSIEDTERAQAAAAAEAIYDSALEISWLRFLIRPESVWMQRAFALGAFAVPKYKAVTIELAGRAQKRAPDGVRVGNAAAPPRDPEPAAGGIIATI